MPEFNTTLRLGTRGSLLARTQSGIVAADLQRAHRGLRVELVVFKTTGDRITDKPLHEFGGKGLFTKELEQALLDEQVDFAVHSFKDMPTTMPLVSHENLIVAAVPMREDPRDVLVAGGQTTIAGLPKGAKVGTGSLRRRCQLLLARPDLQIEAIRGNIDTRLRKQRDGEYHAIVLAMAGMKRTALFDPATMSAIDANILLPAPGQGALALQCRRNDQRTRDLLLALHHPPTAVCVEAERELVALLEGDCLSPIAAMAEVRGQGLTLQAAVGSRGGDLPVLKAVGESNLSDPADAARRAFEKLETQGAKAQLRDGDGEAR